MNQTQLTLLNDVLQQDAPQVQAWINSVWVGQKQVPKTFNWLGLAEAAAFKARSELDLDWATIATSIYDHLATKADTTERNSLLLSSMNLRAYLILNLGTISDDPILDVDKIINWFFLNLEISHEEVLKKITCWKDLSIEDIKKLRKIKNRLTLINLLAENAQLQLDAELKNWLVLWDKLP